MAQVMTRSLPKVTPVSAGASVTISVPTGNRTIAGIGLKLTGLAKSEITEINVNPVSKAFQRFATVADLEVLTGYYGGNIDADVIYIPASRLHMVNPVEGRFFNWGLDDVSIFDVTLQIDAGVVGSPGIEAWADIYVNDPLPALPRPNTFGRGTKIRRYTHYVGGAGVFEIDDIPREAAMAAIHFGSSAITHVHAEIDGQKVWEGDVARMVQQVENAKRVRQANWFHVDWLLSNELGTQLAIGKDSSGGDLVADMRFFITTDGATTITTQVEYLSGLGGI